MESRSPITARAQGETRHDGVVAPEAERRDQSNAPATREPEREAAPPDARTRDNASTTADQYSRDDRDNEIAAVPSRVPRGEDEPPVLRRRPAGAPPLETSRSRYPATVVDTHPEDEPTDNDAEMDATAPVVQNPTVERPSRRASAAIIGGGAVLGAVIGAITGGRKGAVIGAASGGAGGYVVDRYRRRK
jgi:hypothetical protein